MRRYDKSAVKGIIKDQVVRSATAVVHSTDCNLVNITLGNSSTLIRGVEVVGDAKKIAPSSVVPITWREGRPVVLQTVGETALPTAVADAAVQSGSYPKNVLLDPDCSYVQGYGPNRATTSSQWFGGHWDVFGVAGDYVEWTFLIDSGVYRLDLLCLKKSASGITQVYLDGIFLDEQDQYVSTTVYNFDWEIPITIQEGGVHVLRLECAGKNSSANNYRLGVNYATICPYY